MAQAAWEKPGRIAVSSKPNGERTKFLVGGLLILAAVVYLIFSGMQAGARFFITVDELVHNAFYQGQPVRVSGAVLGDTIVYDEATLTIDFTVVHIPEGQDVTGQTLHEAVNNPALTRMHVRVVNQVKPDLLRHEAQAIMTGTLSDDGVFYATELNLKCPSRFIEGGPGALEAAAEV